MVSKMVRRVSSWVPLFKICGFLIDELSTADKSQFSRNSSLLGVALRSRRSLRFKFRCQAVGMVFRLCPVAAVFWLGLRGLCAVPTARPPDAADGVSFQGLVALAS